MKDSRGGGSDGTTCSLPNGIRTGPVTNDVVADSRDQPNKRAHSTNAGTVTTTHGLPTRIARNTRAGPVPSTCEAAQPPKPLTTAYSEPAQVRECMDTQKGLLIKYISPALLRRFYGGDCP